MLMVKYIWNRRIVEKKKGQHGNKIINKTNIISGIANINWSDL